MEITQFLNPYLQKRLKKDGIEKFLDSLGDERLRQKKTRMENLLKIATNGHWGQVFKLDISKILKKLRVRKGKSNSYKN